MAVLGLGLAVIFTQEIVIALLGAGVTILTTGAILVSNFRSRKQEALQVHAATLTEDCDSLRQRVSRLESELRIAQDTIADLREKYLQCLHEQHLLQETHVECPRLPLVSAEPVQTLDVTQS